MGARKGHFTRKKAERERQGTTKMTKANRTDQKHGAHGVIYLASFI